MSFIATMFYFCFYCIYVYRRLDDLVSAIGHFLWPQRDHGTLSRSPCEQFHLI